MTLALMPPSEHVHWWFAGGLLLLGQCLFARAVVGADVWDRRRWRRYLLPSLFFVLGILLWPVMVLYATSTIHLLAHGAWAQVAMLAGGAMLGLAAGKLTSSLWLLTVPLALGVSGAAFLVHEQNAWLYSRSTFVHHASGWVLVVSAIALAALAFRPRLRAFNAVFALTFVVLAIIMFSDRDVAPVFGHLSPEAGVAHR